MHLPAPRLTAETQSERGQLVRSAEQEVGHSDLRRGIAAAMRLRFLGTLHSVIGDYVNLADATNVAPIRFQNTREHSEKSGIADEWISVKNKYTRSAEEEVYEVIEGELEIKIDGAIHLVRPGIVAIVPANVRHHVRAITDGRVIVIDHPARSVFLNTLTSVTHRTMQPEEESLTTPFCNRYSHK